MSKKARSNELWIAVGVLAVIILVATGTIKYSNTGGLTFAVGGTPSGPTTTIANGQPVGTPVNSCNPVPKIQLTTKYANASANNGAGGYTVVVAPYNAFVAGSTSVYQAGVTSTSAVTNITATCNQAYVLIVGNNIGTYVNGTTLTTTTSPLQNLNIYVAAVATPTLLFKNATSAGYTKGGGRIDGVSNNQVLSAGQVLSIQVASTGAGACFGNPNYAIQFSYNAVQVPSIAIPGYQQVTQTLPSETSFSTGSSQIAFQVPGPLCNYAVATLNPTVQLGTVPTGTANTANTYSAVGVYLIPQTNLLYNGALLTGYYVTPGTTTVLGAVTSNSVGINFGTT